MKKIIATFALILGITGLFAFAPVHQRAYADAKQTVCEGIGLVGDNGQCEQSASDPTVSGIIKTAINILSYVVGIAAIIMIILGAFNFITSGGDAAKVKSAKNAITYALVGLVVAALAQVLVHFVLTRATTPTTSTPTNQTPDPIETGPR